MGKVYQMQHVRLFCRTRIFYIDVTNSPVSQNERTREVALASSAYVDKTTKIITEFTRKDPFSHLKRSELSTAKGTIMK